MATHEAPGSTGVAELDTMLAGGLLASSSTMVLGFAGSGKTLLGLHFLEAGARRKEPGLYFGFYESPERLIEGAVRSGCRSHSRSMRG